MKKPTHKEVKFSPAEVADDGSDEIDFSRVRYLGRGPAGMEMARRVSQARGEEKRKLVDSLPRGDQIGASAPKVALEPDVAAVFKDAASVNKALRAFIQAMPATETRKHRKTA